MKTTINCTQQTQLEHITAENEQTNLWMMRERERETDAMDRESTSASETEHLENESA